MGISSAVSVDVASAFWAWLRNSGVHDQPVSSVLTAMSHTLLQSSKLKAFSVQRRMPES